MNSLHAQASAVDVAWTQAQRRGNPGMKPAQWEYLAPQLAAACFTLRLIDANRHRLPADFIKEIEGER